MGSDFSRQMCCCYMKDDVRQYGMYATVNGYTSGMQALNEMAKPLESGAVTPEDVDPAKCTAYKDSMPAYFHTEEGN